MKIPLSMCPIRGVLICTTIIRALSFVAGDGAEFGPSEIGSDRTLRKAVPVLQLVF